ncbi:dethiobiotin synthase [Chitinilyticum piscinae]|uniref:ATP-dependent dethiobiotin synthetase BioD n=1 Tax=Chitinilyticum piscinae TaxID=2866724 RepID=A0A8J7FIR9_9NEIS|nr:dethiobiotin synthase [Chitinilyticum piscinae]MBE9610128.1 dethiobiotin synthase [Chitinilyticum piscinae]
MGKVVFITGTDTDAGKSVVTAQLLRGLARQGLRTVGMKPVASGCEARDGDLWSSDVALHACASSLKADRALTSPYRFEPPVSPHIAASEAGVLIDLARLRSALDALRQASDLVLVEGAGGWLAPLSDTMSMADLADELALPVVLVVGMKLGCINHALLSARAIMQGQCRLLGWVANQLDPAMLRYDENLTYLKQAMPVPLLAEVLYEPDAANKALPCPALLSLLDQLEG